MTQRRRTFEPGSSRLGRAQRARLISPWPGTTAACQLIGGVYRRTLRQMDTGAALTHVDATGAARMVDVSTKEVTVRRAGAAGSVRTTTEVVGLLHRDALPKGDPLPVAP